jgi:hypothetical protein
MLHFLTEKLLKLIKFTLGRKTEEISKNNEESLQIKAANFHGFLYQWTEAAAWQRHSKTWCFIYLFTCGLFVETQTLDLQITWKEAVVA